MLRRCKHVDWAAHLPAQDVAFLKEEILASAWYPMATFERFGIAILTHIAGGNLDAVRAWGSASIDSFVNRNLIVKDDPRASLMRFQYTRSELFDFTAYTFERLVKGNARIRVSFDMNAVAAEEAASHQALGFLQRLVEASGARQCQASFASRSWTGDPVTIIELSWSEVAKA
jgi:hypothetical protein